MAVAYLFLLGVSCVSRKLFKLLCILSVAVFVLLVLFALLCWLLVNMGGVLFLMLTMGQAEVQVGGITLAQLLENFVGSPLFYAYVVDILAFAVSVTGLTILNKKSVS